VNVALDLAVEVELSSIESGYRISQGDSLIEARSPEELSNTQDGALLGHIAQTLSLPPFDARIKSDSPRGGGLGASSALAVAAIAAGESMVGREESSPEARSALARDIEARLMQLPTGRQDHYPALLGGALEIRHEPGREQVRRIDVDLDALGECLVIAYTGQSHFSAGNNWMVVRRRLEKDPIVIRCFDGIRDIAQKIIEPLEKGEFEKVGRLVSQEWEWRRQLSEHKSTPMIESILNRALSTGAWGGKACGAGGGGCVLLLCPAERRQVISENLTDLGAKILTTHLASEPLQVVDS
jgi:D-glycero-alpha-D-manno-heptose-7-phosphate kinase